MSKPTSASSPPLPITPPIVDREDADLVIAEGWQERQGVLYRPILPATPSSPPAELTEALIAHERLCMEDLRAAFGAEDASRAITPVTTRILDSRAALVAIYDRQREEIERLTKLASLLDSEQMEANEKLEYHLKGDRVNPCPECASLLAQLERLTAKEAESQRRLEFASGLISAMGKDMDHAEAKFADLEASVERLKASQLTPEEAANVLRLIPRGWLEEECAKLRLRSLSDQKND